MDEFGPLNLQPHPGKQWAPVAAGKGNSAQPRRRRMRATFNRPHGVRHLMAGYDLSTDRLYGHIVKKKDRTAFLAFCRYLRSLHPPEVRIAIVLDNFSPHRSTKNDTRVGDWAAANNVELAYVPFYASWLNRIEAQFTALRYFALDGTDHPTHQAQARMIRRYIAWRNRHTSATGRLTPLDFLTSPVVAFLVAVFLALAVCLMAPGSGAAFPVAAFLARAFLAGRLGATRLRAAADALAPDEASTVSVPGAGTTIVFSPDGHLTRRIDPVTAVTTPSRSGPLPDDRRIRAPTFTMSGILLTRSMTAAPYAADAPRGWRRPMQSQGCGCRRSGRRRADSGTARSCDHLASTFERYTSAPRAGTRPPDRG